MSGLKNTAWEWYKSVVVDLKGAMTVSSFQKTGKLTPEEFVAAGDALVQKCPAWEWAPGDKAIQPFLPAEKKFLILRNAPSRERATAMMADEGGAKDDEDDWVSTHANHVVKKPEAAKLEEETKEGSWGDDDDDADDQKAPALDDGIRTYDLTVLYDTFHATARMYFIGYAKSQPLTPEQMMEDVYSENRGKTVTIDPHPFMKAMSISIHPCRHAETMQRILQRMGDRIVDQQEEAGVPEKDRVPFVFPTYLALFVFLKFISSVVPTISYDVAMEVDM